MDFEMNFSLEQKQALAPQMIHSLNILRMGYCELEAFLEAFAQENPVVELTAPKQTARAVIPYEWRTLAAGASGDVALENLPGQGADGLRDDLIFQMGALSLGEEQARCLRFYIDSLDENGYLHISLEEAAALCPCDAGTAAAALSLLKQMEPQGVGAGSLCECIVLQLQGPENELARVIAANYLPEMSRNNLQAIAKETGRGMEEVRGACARIRQCNPKPGNGYGGGGPEQFVFPDLFVIADENGELQIVLNDMLCPYIEINPYYQKMSTSELDRAAVRYIREKLQEASAVIGHIARRNLTLLQCMQTVAAFQRDFFLKGPSFLRPLSVEAVAKAMDVNPSTVSRAVHGKYVKSIWGVTPIRSLFARSSQPEGGRELTPHSIGQMIAELINAENKRRPLSDQKLADELQAQGVSISRRTVNKYREQAGIPAASLRRTQ